jgi:hypothetical protein
MIYRIAIVQSSEEAGEVDTVVSVLQGSNAQQVADAAKKLFEGKIRDGLRSLKCDQNDDAVHCWYSMGGAAILGWPRLQELDWIATWKKIEWTYRDGSDAVTIRVVRGISVGVFDI